MSGLGEKLDSLQQSFNNKLEEVELQARVLVMKRLKSEETRKRKKKSKRIKRKRITLFRKVHELGKSDDLKIAVIIFHNGQYFTYRNMDEKS